MIYINADLVDFNNRKEDYKYADVVKEYHKTISDLIERHGDTVVFKTQDTLRLDEITKVAKPFKGYSWRNQLTLINGSTQQKWIYSNSTATIKDGVVDTSDPNFRVDRGEIHLSLTEEPDRVFFLTKHESVKRGILRIDDPEANEKSRADSMRQETKFKDLIYSELSPLYDDIDKLKSIARKWGVDDCDTRSEASIRNALFDKVQAGELAKKKNQKEHGIADFIADTDMGEGVKVGSVVQRAIDKGILSFNRPTKEWQLIIDKDQMPLSLMMVSDANANRSRAALNDFLLKNKHDVDVIEQALDGEVVLKYGTVHQKGTVTIDEVCTVDTIDTASWTEIQKTAKAINLNIFKKKAEDARAMVKERLMELALEG